MARAGKSFRFLQAQQTPKTQVSQLKTLYVLVFSFQLKHLQYWAMVPIEAAQIVKCLPSI